jgi:uncharacterized protein YprB with RNaseH-like and TPR domain/predicted nuclease with RNAse H fold
MIQNSFIFIPGIGEKGEEQFWKGGFLSWEDLQGNIGLNGSNKPKNKIILDYLEKANDAINNLDISFFKKNLPQKDYWRTYKAFQDRTVFLDIETTGLSTYYDVITLICAYDGTNIKVFVKDINLEGIIEYLKTFSIIITFNGKLFDIPFLKKQYPDILIPPVHIDLRFLLKSLGITGPLKEIERRLEINRKDDIQHFSGRDAVVLWNQFLRNDSEAFRKLVQYNISDTFNLKKLMHFSYNEKVRKDILPKLEQNNAQNSLFTKIKRNLLSYDLASHNIEIPDVTIERQDNYLHLYYNRSPLIIMNKDNIKRTELKIDKLITIINEKGNIPLVVGIDLSGSEDKPSGFCILKGKKAYLSMVRTDAELISAAAKIKPSIISIDSPLSIPKGRDCVNDSCECRKYGIMRTCERLLKKRGINVYPCLINSMQKLTSRGMNLSIVFENINLPVIESYPGAAQDILRFPRKRINLKELEIDLLNMGIKPYSQKEIITHDEIDALTSALVGYFYLAGMYEAIGDIDEGYLIIPDLRKEIKQVGPIWT